MVESAKTHLVVENFGLKPVMSAKRKRRVRDGIGVNEAHYVYFLSIGDASLVKIGFTVNMKERFRQLAAQAEANGQDAKALGYVRIPYGQGRALETAMHDAFSDRHKHGEWFELDGINLKQAVVDIARATVDGDWTIFGLDLADDAPPDDNRPSAAFRSLKRHQGLGGLLAQRWA